MANLAILSWSIVVVIVAHSAVRRVAVAAEDVAAAAALGAVALVCVPVAAAAGDIGHAAEEGKEGKEPDSKHGYTKTIHIYRRFQEPFYTASINSFAIKDIKS